VNTAAVQKMLDAIPVLPDGVDVDAIRSWEVRLLCPRGHFCLNLLVVDLLEGVALLQPLDKDRQPVGVEAIGEIVRTGLSRPPRGTEEWIRKSGNRVGVYARAEVEVECGNKRCAYSGSFEYFALALEVCAAAADGDREYRLAA
jgi:hypothetical protein